VLKILGLPSDNHALLIGLFGAAETLCETAASRRLSPEEAKRALAALFARSIQTEKSAS
jgi:hypothetical protein